MSTTLERLREMQGKRLDSADHWPVLKYAIRLAEAAETHLRESYPPDLECDRMRWDELRAALDAPLEGDDG